MEGKQFSEAYTPTTAINVTSILWSYKVTSDTVKVDVWDVSGQRKAPEEGECATEACQRSRTDFLDVYKNTNGVVFVYDITKLGKGVFIARHCSVLHRTPQPTRGGSHREIRRRVHEGRLWIDASLQVSEHPISASTARSLAATVKSNREQVLAANEELEAASKAEDQNYELYKETMSKKTLAEKERRRKEKEEMEALKRKEQETQPSAPAEKKKKEKEAQEKEPAPEPTKRSEPADKQARDSTDKTVISIAGFYVPSQSRQLSVPTATALPAVSKPKTTVASSEAVEEFVPEGEGVQNLPSDDDDDEEVAINPLVARDEDLSSLEGEEPPAPAKKEEKKGSTAVQRDVSSDGEEDGKKDEDVSSDDEAKKKTSYSNGKKPSIVQQDEDISSDEGEGKQKLVITADKDISSDEDQSRKPTKSALPPKASPKAAALPKVQLKSAKEIVLTESEGDGEEEQSPEDATAILKPVTVKPISQGFMSFDLSDVTKSSPAVAVKASSGEGKEVIKQEGAQGTQGGREGKDGESKSKKSSKKSKDDGEKAKKKGDDMKQEPADPFAPLSLDAWLDGDDDTKDVERTDGDDGKGKHKKKKHKSESGKKSKRKASDGGEDYGQL
eukprot:Em0016g71a